MPRSLFVDWEWYSDPKTNWLYCILLARANFEDKSWKGRVICTGQLVTSVDKLSKVSGLSAREVRTALNHLQTTNYLTIETTSKYSLITLNNYIKITRIDKVSDKQTTSKRQTNDNNYTINTINPSKEKNILSKWDESFGRFWSVYPRKEKKIEARKNWYRLKPDEALVEHILYAVGEFVQKEQWQNAQFIPLPTSFINQRRWEEIEKKKPEPRFNLIRDEDSLENRLFGRGERVVNDCANLP